MLTISPISSTSGTSRGCSIARERPRDVDTILDLTTRIDAMLALVIAYDRTIAAIERSLEALRGDG